MDVDASPTAAASISIPTSHDNKAPKKKEVARIAADAATSRILPNGLVRQLVLSYLLRNCYRATALAFVAADGESDLADDGPAPPTQPADDANMTDDVVPAQRAAQTSCLTPLELGQLDQRRAMMDHILVGDILGGIALAESLLSSSASGAQSTTVRAAFPMVYLRLLCQHFVELVRQRKTIDALSFAQQTIAPLGKVNPAGLPLLQNYLPLLAYSEPEMSPIFELVDTRHREALAEELNDHVFSYLHYVQSNSQPPKVQRQSELERLMRHLSVLMNKLPDKDDRPKWTLASVIADSKSEKK